MDYIQKMSEANKLDDITSIDIKSYKELVEELRNQPVVHPISTGLKTLDDIIGGFKEEKLYVLSAPTKMGKTTMAQTLMYMMAKEGNASMMFSYEMSWQEIIRKFMLMDKKTLSEEPTDLPLFVPMDLHRGGGFLQYQWLFDAIAKAKKENNIKLAIIDHLHFLLPLKDFRNTSFVIGGIVREIKKMAVTLKIPIILISHVAKIKDDRKPDWTDIRDSSFITQEADAVFMMYRQTNEQEKKKTTDVSTEDKYTNYSIFSVELNRETGKSGKIALWHNGAMFEKTDQKTTELVLEIKKAQKNQDKIFNAL